MSGGPSVDLRSDTVTRPTPAMRRAMAEAPVADDVLDGDPTTARLEARVAELLGKERALFFPSGTQANQAAVLAQAPPGSELVCEAEAHVLHYELAGPAFLAGVQLRTFASEGGDFRVEACERLLRPGDRWHPPTGLVWMENTHNLHGGRVVPLELLRGVKEAAATRGVPVHLDGARLWNAAAATGVELRAWAACADTVMVSLSKGLGCPVGSLLAGPGQVLERAWTARRRLGGGMRQSGILAAAGLHALEHHRRDLPEDHRRARRLAEGAGAIPGLGADPPGTNIVMLELAEGLGAGALCRAAARRGLLMLPAGPDRVRAVTHRDVDDAGVERALEALSGAVRSLRSA